MDEFDRAEMRALCDQFRQLMRRDLDPMLFDQESCERAGEMIGRAMRRRGSAFAYNLKR